MATSSVPQLRLRIKQSKTDPFGQGCYVYLTQTSRAACPITALRAYLSVRGPALGPLFVWSDGSPLIAAHVNYFLRALLYRAGVSGYYASHSFRIGAATSAAAAGVPDHLIQALGRWSSAAYLQYIRTSPTVLMDAVAMSKCLIGWRLCCGEVPMVTYSNHYRWSENISGGGSIGW